MLRSAVTVIALAATTLAAPMLALANPASDLFAAWRAFGTVKSYHAEIKTANNHNVAMDVMVPNKTHVTMSQGMQMIHIDAGTWIYRGGSWMKIPVAMPQMGAMTDGARNLGLKGKPDADDYTITYLGPALVNGAATQHYRIARKDGSTKPVEMWIGANHLPVEVMAQGDNGPVTILYSNYNGVSDITAPM